MPITLTSPNLAVITFSKVCRSICDQSGVDHQHITWQKVSKSFTNKPDLWSIQRDDRVMGGAELQGNSLLPCCGRGGLVALSPGVDGRTLLSPGERHRVFPVIAVYFSPRHAGPAHQHDHCTPAVQLHC